MTSQTLTLGARRNFAAFAANYSVVVAFVVVCAVFSFSSPTFLTTANLSNVVINGVVMLAIVALGESIVVASGGIDLSVGVSVDMASMIFIMLMAAGYGAFVGVIAGLGAALCVGLLNAVLVTRLKISPFLATLGVLFIGRSTQQLATGGGLPIYLITGPSVETFKAIARSSFLGIVTPVWVFVVCAVVVYLVMHRSVFGRYVQALGAQPGVAWYSGVRVSRQLSLVYVACALLCGITGILLSATVRSYVPLSGNAFQLDAIGATFIGTTLTPERRPSVIGTILGVMLLAIFKNGLLLVGWNFYWQQVGIGVLVFLVLSASFGLRGRAH